MDFDPLAQTEQTQEGEIDQRILELSREYLEELRAGESPSRDLYLARYPERQSELSEYLEGIELAHVLEKDKSKSASHAKPDQTQHPLEPIGDFRIVREIGRGGMGIVYEAIQCSLGRSVALKVLPFAAALDERHRKRFLLEAQAAAQLHHNHIVPVYAVGCERGTHYYAMQLINGQPISTQLFNDEATVVPVKSATQDTVRTGRSTQTTSGLARQTKYQRIASLIADVAEGLEYAHSCGVVHRDVKPANLLLDEQGKIWIADFGLAQITTGEHVTQTGDMLGTMRYMSPEQASGSRGVVDHRSDVYSLGATLYELLTQQPVFNGADRQKLLHQVLHDDPRSLRSIDKAIPEELEIITLKALRHSPGERYESAQCFADDLNRFLNEIPITARRPTLVDQGRKWMRRHPTAVVSLLFAMLVTMISMAVMIGVVSNQKSLTQQALRREQIRTSQAEKRLATAQAAADEMIRMAQNEFTRTPMEETLRVKMLASALTYYQTLIEDTELESATRAELTETYKEVAAIREELVLRREDRAFSLLLQPRVQQELKLSADQQASLLSNPAFEQLNPQVQQTEQAVRQRHQIVDRVLSKEQRERLGQIALQVQGPSAILESIFTGSLNLSQAQATEIQQTFLDYLISNAHAKPSEIEQTGLSPASFRPDEWLDDGMRRELMGLVLERLTPEQKEAWSKIVGPEFSLGKD